MAIKRQIIEKFSKKVESAIASVKKKFPQEIADEDDFTSRLLQQLESNIDGWQDDNTVWTVETIIEVNDRENSVSLKARKLKAKGYAGVEEGEFGADIVIVVKMKIQGYNVNKGVLVQSKCLDIDDHLNKSEWDRLQKQIGKMNHHTSESFVWLYSADGVRSVKAETLIGIDGRRPDNAETIKCSSFLGEFLKCDHGDHAMTANDRNSLRMLRKDVGAKSAALIMAKRRTLV